VRTWVTGGSSGIGWETAALLARYGHGVLCFSRRGLAPQKTRGVIVDQGSMELERQLGEILAAHGAPDAAVLSAGMGAFVGVHETTRERLEELFAVNAIGPLVIAARLVAELRHRKRPGRVLLITSTCATQGGHALGCYAASKAAVEAWVRCEGPHQRRKGVDVLAVSPGWIETEMTARLRPEIRRAAEARSPEGRFASVGEAAEFVVRVLLDAESFPGGSIVPFWQPSPRSAA
jgi:NAD(P)-dependent dehydrogenase (short-subunit alcohol dehydrogenase family)